jgi:hypothetical protein
VCPLDMLWRHTSPSIKGASYHSGSQTAGQTICKNDLGRPGQFKKNYVNFRFWVETCLKNGQMLLTTYYPTLCRRCPINILLRQLSPLSKDLLTSLGPSLTAGQGICTNSLGQGGQF